MGIFLARSRFTSIAAAILLVIVCTVALYPLENVLHDPVVALLYLLPVTISTAYGGLGAGIAAAAVAFFTFNYFFIEPYYSLFVRHTQDFLELFVFLGVAVFTSQAMGRAKAALIAAKQGEWLAHWLHELSSTLARQRDGITIAKELANHCQQVVLAQQVEISLDMSPGSPPQVIRFPQSVAVIKTRPSLVIPLESARGLMGEIALWRETLFTPIEERLLRISASQGALALERARLLHGETRARVLEESDQLKTALLNSVSHELRTPLATIKASISSLRSGAVDWDLESRHELLAVVEEETDNLNQLVGNLLNMSRLEAGVLRPQRSWNILIEVASTVIARIRGTYPDAEIFTDFPADLPLVPIDYGLIEQVFANLLGNSLKYTPSDKPINVGAFLQDVENVQVYIINQGMPISQADLGRIFEKFYRISVDGQVSGTGLGLSICKGIIEAHGGRIWAENLLESQPGIAFKFTLPLQVDGLSPPVYRGVELS